MMFKLFAFLAVAATFANAAEEQQSIADSCPGNIPQALKLLHEYKMANKESMKAAHKECRNKATKAEKRACRKAICQSAKEAVVSANPELGAIDGAAMKKCMKMIKKQMSKFAMEMSVADREAIINGCDSVAHTEPEKEAAMSSEDFDACKTMEKKQLRKCIHGAMKAYNEKLSGNKKYLRCIKKAFKQVMHGQMEALFAGPAQPAQPAN